MTEYEWLTSKDPSAMLMFALHDDAYGSPIGFRVTERKLRLALKTLNPESLWGSPTKGERRWIDRGGLKLRRSEAVDKDIKWFGCVRSAVELARGYVYDHAHSTMRIQPDVLRELLGNPYRKLQPLTWRTPDVVTFAQLLYDRHDYQRLPEIWDLMVDGGCEDDEIRKHVLNLEACPECLNSDHCRWAKKAGSPVCPDCDCTRLRRRADKAAHIWGCWVLDLILGKS